MVARLLVLSRDAAEAYDPQRRAACISIGVAVQGSVDHLEWHWGSRMFAGEGARDCASKCRSFATRTFGSGEEKLSEWMAANAFVCWVEHPRP